jgi:hypothetical protein
VRPSQRALLLLVIAPLTVTDAAAQSIPIRTFACPENLISGRNGTLSRISSLRELWRSQGYWVSVDEVIDILSGSILCTQMRIFVMSITEKCVFS